MTQSFATQGGGSRGCRRRKTSRTKPALTALVLCTTAAIGCGDKRSRDSVTSSALTDPSPVTLLPACISKTGAAEQWATFGYDSAATRPIVVDVGIANGFSPAPADRGQPTRFDPGRHALAFSVQLGGQPLTWTLGQHTVTASSASPACVSTTSGTQPLLASFVLYAQTEIRLDGVSVNGGDVGVVDKGQPADQREQVSVGASGHVDLTRGVFGDAVELAPHAAVGAVFTNRLDNRNGSAVSVGPFPTNMPALPALEPIDPGSQAVAVQQGKTATLQPGAYGAVTVNGTLTLAGGTFQMASLDVGRAGRVEAAAGARLRIKGALHLGEQALLRSNPVGLARDLVVEVAAAGAGAVVVQPSAEVHALLTAPAGSLVLFPHVRARGAFAAHDIIVKEDARVVFESGFPLPLKQCAAAFQISTDQLTPGKDPQDLAHQIAATACLAPDASSCEVTLIGTANFDRRAAAKKMVAGLFTPAQYLAIARDRSRKLLLAEKDPTWAAAFCRGDADGDLVPDDRDNCPGTPPLTATDDHGCTDPNLPRAPDPDKMKRIFDRVGLMISATCDGAPEPLAPVVSDVCLDRPNLRYLITVSKDPRQPPRCQVWYQMNTLAIERFEARETFRALLGFERGQAVAETATTVTLPLPLTCDPVEIPGDGRSWPCDEASGDPFNTTVVARAMNGNGQQSPWGGARQFPFHLCP